MSDNSHAFRRLRPRIALRAALVVVLCLSLTGCSADDPTGVVLTGSFIDDSLVVPVPDLPATPVDPFVGTEPSAEGTPGATSDGGAPATALVLPVLTASSPLGQTWQRVEEVQVSPGDQIVAGQVLAVLDDGAAQATVTAAEADLARSEAELALIDEMSGDVEEGRSEAESQTVELEQTLADLQTQRIELQAELNAARQAAAPPANPTTTTPIPPSLLEQIAKLEAALSELDAGIQQTQDAIDQIAEAEAELEDVETALGSIRDTAKAVVSGRRAVVELTRTLAQMAIVTAPIDGVIVSVATPGEVLASGAPLAIIRSRARPTVRTYLTAEQARQVRDGSSARVSLDSLEGTEYTGLVTRVGSTYDYVPTTFATDIIHMTRGFEAIVEVYGAPELPAGTPADLVIQTD